MDLRAQLANALRQFDVPATPIVVDTAWDVGAVTAYLFPARPVTLIDATVNTPQARRAITDALAQHALKPSDVEQVIVTHAHSDHYGGAVWLQEASGCAVYAHAADVELVSNTVDWRETERVLFPPLGFTEQEVERFFGDWSGGFARPEFTACHDGDVFGVGASRLRIEHHAGHSLGHVWVVEEVTGATFVGDYVIADHPTNAGLERDPSHPTGRAQLLQAYNAGLRALAQRDTPLVLAGHGPPMTDHKDVIARRLAKSERRTRSVLQGVRDNGPISAVALGRLLYRDRMDTNWEVVSDLVGRLDLLVAEGRATSRMGEDGVWYFTAIG